MQDGQIGVLAIFVVISVLCVIFCASGSHVDAENEYCEQTDQGVVCVSDEDMRLTRMDGGQVGDVKSITVDDDRVLHVKTLNIKPLVFEVKDMLTDEECDHFINVAKEIGLKSSHTERQSTSTDISLMDLNNDHQLSLAEMKLTLENGYDVYLEDDDVIEMYSKLGMDPNNDGMVTREEMQPINPALMKAYLKTYLAENPEKHSRYSRQAWLFPDESSDTVFRQVQERVSKVVDLPMDLILLSDFQVVNYGVKGHYNAHLDSSQLNKEQQCCDRGKYQNCRICRYMTVLFYLNEVTSGGDTAFPYAHRETINKTSAYLERVHHLYKKCEDVSLRITAQKRKAVIWYNHFIDEQTGWMGDIDDYTLHGSCPVLAGEKWIANFWIKVNDDKSIDLAKIKKLSLH